MSLQSKRMWILLTVALLLTLSILDITFRDEEVFESFGVQFVDVARTEAFERSHQDVTKSFVKELEVEPQGATEVSLDSKEGSLAIERSPDEKLRMTYTVTATGRDEADAVERGEAVKVEAQREGDALVLAASADGGSVDYDPVSIDYTLWVPDHTKLILESEETTVRIKGTVGDLEIKMDRESLEVVGVQGELVLDTSYSNEYIAKHKGGVQVTSRYSRVNMDQVIGDIQLDNQSGHMVLYQIEGAVIAESDLGSVQVRDLLGSIEFEGMQTTTLLDHIQGDTTIRSVSSEVTLILPTDADYEVDVNVNSTLLHAQLPLTIEKDSDGEYDTTMKGVLGDGAWKLAVEAESSEFYIHSK